MGKYIYKRISQKQLEFLEWINKHKHVDKLNKNCLIHILCTHEYLIDGKWKIRLNEMRNKYLSEYESHLKHMKI